MSTSKTSSSDDGAKPGETKRFVFLTGDGGLSPDPFRLPALAAARARQWRLLQNAMEDGAALSGAATDYERAFVAWAAELDAESLGTVLALLWAEDVGDADAPPLEAEPRATACADCWCGLDRKTHASNGAAHQFAPRAFETTVQRSPDSLRAAALESGRRANPIALRDTENTA
jgi:hypothetical protein